MLSSSHPKNQPFTVAEFGAADGSISMELITDIIDVVREKSHPDKQIHIMYEDIPTNEFNSLYKRMNGIIPKPRSYLLDYDNVFVTTSGTNFFNQCFPSSSVDLALAFNATHYLSKPLPLSDHVYRFFPGNQEEREAITKQAGADWLVFLKHRANELKQGGWGVFSTVGETEATLDEPAMMGPHDIFAIMDDIWKGFVSKGLITKEEYQRFSFAACFRNARELQEPFNSEELRKTGLRFDGVKFAILPCFFATEWKERLEKGIDDRAMFARDITTNTRTYSYSSFYGSLNDDRTAEEKSQICDLLYKEMETYFLSKHPEDFMNDYLTNTIYVFKE
ncbi:hypothetical protein SNE40_003816 [Patella caerulea]|uniref:Uncharacterized protein n=1 Tax=Patella caerulea TaxID=87958 RepID=A0AAN8K8N3_PATCE